MKRGLITLGGTAEVREHRLAELRSRMAEAELDAVVVYVNVFRSDDLAHLTGLNLYWNEGALLVPASSDPIFLTRLSARTQEWMRSVSILEEIVSGPDLGGNIVTKLTGLEVSRVGLVDRDLWPIQLVEKVERALDEVVLVDLPRFVTAARLAPDDVERAALRNAATIARTAVGAAVGAAADDPDAALGEVERSARRAGATDVLAEVRRIDVEAANVHVRVHTAGVWGEHASVVGATHEAWQPALHAAFDAVRDALCPQVTIEQLRDIASSALGAHADAPFELRCVPHTEIGTRGELDPFDDAGPEGGVVALAIELVVPAGPTVVLADVFELTGSGARPVGDAVPTTDTEDVPCAS